MSEYQYYEFVALDRPLTQKQMAELRAISTRAEISPTRFWNEYQWGDLKADPAQLLERYFDAHLYFANWGTHRLMLRLPRARIDPQALKPFFPGRNNRRLTLGREHVVLDLRSDCEEPEDETQRPGSLATLAGLRMELLRGDLRGAYLAWLLAVQVGDVGDTASEPPVPVGLSSLSAAQVALVDFLDIDVDLLAAAAHASPAPASDAAAFKLWVTRLPSPQKEAWLLRAVDDLALSLGGELLREFRARQGPRATDSRRTVRELRASALGQRAAREEAQAAHARSVRAAAEKQRQLRLDQLSRDVPAAWTRLEQLVATSAYEDAVRLARDLRDLSLREGDSSGFSARFDALHERQSRRRGFFARWRHA